MLAVSKGNCGLKNLSHSRNVSDSALSIFHEENEKYETTQLLSDTYEDSHPAQLSKYLLVLERVALPVSLLTEVQMATRRIRTSRYMARSTASKATNQTHAFVFIRVVTD